VKEKVKSRVDTLKNRWVISYRKWKEKNFIASSGFIYWIAIILIGMYYADQFSRIIVPEWIGYFMIMGVCLLIGWILKLIMKWISILFFRRSIEGVIAALMIVLITIGGVACFTFRISRLPYVFIGLIIGSLTILFLKSLWSLVVGRLITVFNMTVILMGSAIIFIGIYFLNSSGYEDTYINTYLKLEQVRDLLTESEKQSFEKSISGGNYTTLSATYDLADADMLSRTINLEGYAQNAGIVGYMKEKYQGYDLDEVPVRGKVWYPKEVSRCPTLFIVHGNHDYIEESYLGYEYLGRYLASYGYVMVSIDENACNLLTNENDARAILLLENIKTLEAYNASKDMPIYQKIDMSQLAIAGHSRGGEAVSIAYLFNEEEVNPNNGETKLDYHFNIKSIIAIAPTIDQYKPTSKSVVLEDVNYLIIHGANDQDLYQFSAMKQYKNIHFTGKGKYIKTSLYCAGCNHGQFNSRWGIYDQDGFYQKVLNIRNFVSEEEQQQIAEIFIKTFLDCTLREDNAHIKLLEDYRVYEAYLPKTLYVQSYQKSDFNALCNFEEDTSLTSGTMEGVTLDVNGGDIWTEGLYPAEALGSNSAIYLQWSGQRTPELSILIPEVSMQDCTLQFDVMNLQENFKEEDAKLLQGKIIVEDKAKERAEVVLSDYATIYPAFLVRLNKLQYLLDQVEYKHQFQTVSIPMQGFTELNKQLDTTQIVKLQIVFADDNGIVALDEVGYSY